VAPAAPVAAKASSSTAAASHGPEGYININSMPASPCYLDGRALGYTPRLHVAASPGPHTVKFHGADGSTKTVAVNVVSGDTRLAVARLK
jgi:hypothetical protein